MPPPPQTNPITSFSSEDYIVPQWSSEPSHKFQQKYIQISFQTIKDGCILGNTPIKKKPFILIGRIADLCDWHIDNPTVSRKHAILQYKKGQNMPYIYDLGAVHGTYVNKNKLPVRAYQQLKPFDMVKFGQSSRYYVLRCPQVQAREQENDNDEQNKFMEILAERKKQLSKQQLKETYLGLLQNDPYFKANNLAKKLHGQSSTSSGPSGVDWGISDQYEVYAYKSENQLQLEPDILRRLPNLDQIQLNKISQFETNLRMYEEVQGQLNQLVNKQKRQYGLEQKLREKKQKLQKKFVEAVEALEKSEDWIRVNVFGQVPVQVAKRKQAEKQGDTYDDDQFYDRTLADKKGKKNIIQEDENQNKDIFTVKDFWKLQKQLRSEIKNLKQLQLTLQNDQNNQNKQQQEDELDAFMKQNNQNLHKQQEQLNSNRIQQSLSKIQSIKSYLIPLIGQAEVLKIEQQQMGVKSSQKMSEQQRKQMKDQQNRKRIQNVLQQLDMIKQAEQEIDEEDIGILQKYAKKHQQEDQQQEYYNRKRARPEQLQRQQHEIQPPLKKMYPNLKEDRDRDKIQEQQQDQQKCFDLTKM